MAKYKINNNNSPHDDTALDAVASASSNVLSEVIDLTSITSSPSPANTLAAAPIDRMKGEETAQDGLNDGSYTDDYVGDLNEYLDRLEKKYCFEFFKRDSLESEHLSEDTLDQNTPPPKRRAVTIAENERRAERSWRRIQRHAFNQHSLESRRKRWQSRNDFLHKQDEKRMQSLITKDRHLEVLRLSTDMKLVVLESEVQHEREEKEDLQAKLTKERMRHQKEIASLRARLGELEKMVVAN